MSIHVQTGISLRFWNKNAGKWNIYEGECAKARIDIFTILVTRYLWSLVIIIIILKYIFCTINHNGNASKAYYICECLDLIYDVNKYTII